MSVSNTRSEDMCAGPNRQKPSKQILMRTYSLRKCSALVGSVKMVPSICLSPASPPSNRPSSTSVATPAAIHRLIHGTAIAMFSSSVYMSATPCHSCRGRLTSAWEASTMMESKAIPFSASPTASSNWSASVA
jgi:hypothetical protein